MDRSIVGWLGRTVDRIDGMAAVERTGRTQVLLLLFFLGGGGGGGGGGGVLVVAVNPMLLPFQILRIFFFFFLLWWWGSGCWWWQWWISNFQAQDLPYIKNGGWGAGGRAQRLHPQCV